MATINSSITTTKAAARATVSMYVIPDMFLFPIPDAKVRQGARTGVSLLEKYVAYLENIMLQYLAVVVFGSLIAVKIPPEHQNDAPAGGKNLFFNKRSWGK